MEKAKMRFLIVSPRQWGMGGPIVLHALCKYLCSEGYDARLLSDYSRVLYDGKISSYALYITHIIRDTTKSLLVKVFGEKMFRRFVSFTSHVDIPVKGCKFTFIPSLDEHTVVVYPDIIGRNFLNAKHVVRWMLYYNRYPKEAYGENDLFFSFSHAFNDNAINPAGRICTITYYNWDVYKRTNFGKREGTCYIIRKGKARKDLPDKFDGVIVDKLPEKDKVKCFNECVYCVSYDCNTAYSSIAAICGCISIVVPEPGKSRKDYIDGKGWGVAFGFDESEINFAKSTVGKLQESFDSVEERNRKNVKFFIRECIKHFNL